MKTLLIAVAALSLTAAAQAQNTGASVPTPSPDTGRGLLGQTYVSLGYAYTDLTGTKVNLQGLNFEYNQPLNTGFDLKLGYTGARTSEFTGTLRNIQNSFDASAVAFVPRPTGAGPMSRSAPAGSGRRTPGSRTTRSCITSRPAWSIS